jgi:hypothetical protein
MTYPGLLMWDGSSKIHYFIDFLHPFSWRLWRTGMLLLTNLKGHKPNVHYSGFPNHPKTKSSLIIYICQSKLKHKCLPLDTLYLIGVGRSKITPKHLTSYVNAPLGKSKSVANFGHLKRIKTSSLT